MNVKKIIHEELGRNLEEIGFEYFQQQRYFWQYKREKEDVCQYIIITTDRYERRYLKVMFYTTAYGQRSMKEFCDFVPEEGAKHWEYWAYENVEELRQIIKEFNRLIFAYGLDFLEEISKPSTDAVPTEELYRYLYDNHEALYEEYLEKFQARDKEPEEVIEIIYEKMTETYDQPFVEVKEFLCGLAALYGHTICWGNRGTWVWLTENKCCRLKNILDTVEEIDSLIFCLSEWDYIRRHGGIRSNRLNKLYKEILYFYYRDHPEEIEYEE